jgi:hypothetical protein
VPAVKEVKMRYREINSLDDFSHDAVVVVDFIGEKEYRRALEKIGTDLNSKGFVTPFDDALFGLELDLLNLERLRTQCSGRFTLLPERCHAGVDFLLGLGQTIPALSEKGKAILLGRIKKGLDEGLWPLRHELGVAANLNKRGWDIGFHDLEEGGGFDYLVAKDGMTYEVEAKAISAFTGWPLKPDNLYKLLVEVKQHFVWQGVGIPYIGATLASSLSPDRAELRRLVSAFSTVARTNTGLDLPDTQISFLGIIPDMSPDKLMLGSNEHARMRRKIVLVNANYPKLVLELDSKKPIQIGRKIIQTTNEAARKQFSRSHPAVIWTHINFISEQVFLGLGAQRDGRASLLDSVANGTLMSDKRNHLSQLVFSGGSFLHKTDSVARSSHKSIVYNSPMYRFGKNVIFEGGRMHPDHKAA